MVIIRNKFDTLQDIFEMNAPNDEYENLVSVHIKVAAVPTNQTEGKMLSSIGVTSSQEKTR